MSIPKEPKVGKPAPKNAGVKPAPKTVANKPNLKLAPRSPIKGGNKAPYGSKNQLKNADHSSKGKTISQLTPSTLQPSKTPVKLPSVKLPNLAEAKAKARAWVYRHSIHPGKFPNSSNPQDYLDYMKRLGGESKK